MSHLQSKLLFETPLVRVFDVDCRAPCSGCGEEEWSGVAQVVVPRRGVFVVHRRTEEAVADANTAHVLGLDDCYRVSHPAHGGDACTVLVFAPEIVLDAFGSCSGRHGTLRSSTQLGARLLTAALTAGRSDVLEAEDASLLVLDALAADLAPCAGTIGAAQRGRVEEVRALLAARPAAAWQLGTVAGAVHCSPFHLARQFRAVTGETVSQYVLRLRLARALDRLAAGERHLGRLAAELGFSSHSHFTARFRSVFGTTPAAVRETLTRPRLGELRTIVTAEPAARP